MILAAIFLVINMAWGMWFWRDNLHGTSACPGIGYGIWIQICHARDPRDHRVLARALLLHGRAKGLELHVRLPAGAVAPLRPLDRVIAISHGRLDEMIDKECEEDDDPYSSNDDDCDDSGLHGVGVFGVLYACIFINLIFSAISAYLLRSAAPESRGVGQGDGDAPPVVTASAADVELANTKA